MLLHIPQTERNTPERVIRHDCVDFRTTHVAGTLSQVYTSCPSTDFKNSSFETNVHWTENCSSLKAPFYPGDADVLLST